MFLSNFGKEFETFDGGLVIIDDSAIRPRNQIEKRQKIYRIMARALSSVYFGCQVWAERNEDKWLEIGMREGITNWYRREKCGESLYRYGIMKDMKFYAENAKHERFSLSSPYRPEDQQENDKIFLTKCRLIFHIIESIIGESRFFQVASLILKKS